MLPRNLVTDLFGTGRLAVDATLGITGVVEDVHGRIAGRPGVAGLVYRSIRGVTRLVGTGTSATLAIAAPLLGEQPSSPRREGLVAVLNGVYGDHLVASGNPLAIPMRLRHAGAPLEPARPALAAALPGATGRVAVLVHGLCMHDLHWHADSPTGLTRVLARDLGYTSIGLHYNTGLHVSTNGRAFAALLEAVLSHWPVPVQELAIIGHSMGGLVTRSACHYGREAGHAWLARLRALVFLGTPHHGAPLERGGSIADLLLELNPYTAPVARLGAARSAGIRDLRHGNLLDEDWQRRPRGQLRDPRRPVPLPAGVNCYAIAAARGREPGGLATKLLGDGLVPVQSALGRHRDPALALRLPAAHQWIGHDLGHLDLLRSRQVHRRVSDWIGAR